jgi:deoxycytidine triphosphate deaminase
MILSSSRTRELFRSGYWRAFEGERALTVDELHFGEHSVDVCLSRYFGRVEANQAIAIDPHEPDTMRYRAFEADSVTIHHGELLLIAVTQRFDCSAPVTLYEDWPAMHFTQMFDGRSTMARMGITVHQSAGYGDFGFNGAFVGELANCGATPITLHAGMRIGQVSFVPVLGHDPREDYRKRGAYNQQNTRPAPPVLGRERF